MTSDIEGQSRKRELALLDDLRMRYEDHGYTFEFEPNRLPPFFGDYHPHAVAMKEGRNVVIEVKRQPGPSNRHSLQRIRKLLDGHPDWELRVVFTGGDLLDELTITPANPSRIRQALEEVRALLAENRPRLAFMSAWSLLEAISAHVGAGTGARPSRPEAVVQSLAAAGVITSSLERRLQGLVDLRNRVVHGDLEAAPTADDVNVVLAGVDEAMGTVAG